ncbi:hypothetical protein MTDSW087_01072 [Methylobacterium dankookense]|uniref:Chromosome partition protein Smc n=2 Tax=Methylobacterium dankookense TaxID=560405 RepID=A0A564FUP6_9HYPH|nr:hypothetical protein [Methylobacterium dankookense]GJD56017.1 hypothetical protein IFDJLNFL_1909 [Methylobacterium dankookense]VUF11390.1 hypothetical protein MTDSW087_01072 [Methylobacterium dankookense]
MIFALGFLAASLCGLLLLPALNTRAARLARRRAEALVPLAPEEIAAERDFLRARFAVEQRRMERRVEAVTARRQADMAAIGARTVEAARLSDELGRRKAEIAEGEALRARLSDELDTARADGQASLATLHALEEAHADLLDGLLAARRERAAAGESGAASEQADLRARLSAAEDALAQALSARRDAVEQENADLRTRIGEVADALTRRERLPAAGAFPAQATPSVATLRG